MEIPSYGFIMGALSLGAGWGWVKWKTTDAVIFPGGNKIVTVKINN